MRFGGALSNIGISDEEVPSKVGRFWELFAQNHHTAAQELGRELTSSIRNVTEASYSFDDDAGVGGEIKEPSTPTVKPSTPASTISAWNYKYETSVVRLNPRDGFCLGRIGNDKAGEFRACLKQDCITSGHVGKRVTRMILPDKDTKWGIKVGISGNALGTNPQVFNSPTLVYKDFPESFRQPGGRMFKLADYKLPAKVWKVLFEGYPGMDVMLGYALVGDDERHSSDSLGPGQKLPPATISSSYVPQVRDEEALLEEVGDDDPPGVMDTSLLLEEDGKPSALPEIPRSSSPFEDNESTFGGVGGNSSEVSFNSEDSDAGIRVDGTTPRFGWEAYGSHGARTPFVGTGSIAISEASPLDAEEITSVILGFKKEIKRLKQESRHRDEALETVLRSLRMDLDHQKLLGAKQASKIRKLTRPDGVTIPPPIHTDTASVLDLAEWGSKEWGIVTRAVTARLDPTLFLKLKDLQGYLTRSEFAEAMEDEHPWANLSPSEIQDQLSAHSRELFEEGGAVVTLIQRMERLESSQGSQSIEIGGMTFADEAAVKVFYNSLGDPEAYRLCLDFVSVLILAQDAFDTEKEGLATKAAAHKAEYKSVTAARVSTGFDLTFPTNILVKSDTASAHEDLGGWKWAPGIATRKAFEGSFHNGTKEAMKRRINLLERTWTNSINAQYPGRDHPRINNVLLSQLRISCGQALHFLESMTAIPDLLQDSGMKPDAAWKRSAVFPKALFEDIAQIRRTVSEATDGGAMMFGAFRTSVLVEEYAKHNFAEHPKIGLMLCLTSFNREGQATEAAVAALSEEAGKIKGHETRINSLEQKHKKLMTNNPNLK